MAVTQPNRQVRLALPVLTAAFLGRAVVVFDMDRRRRPFASLRRLFGRARRDRRRETTAEILRAVEERDHRMAAATHDFLNALAGLAGYLELLADEPASEQSRELQRKAHDVAERLGMLGEDLLVHATAGSGQLSIEPAQVSVSEELRACALAFPRLEIHLDVDEDLVVLADRLRLHQVLCNLIRNAQRYGRPPVTIVARGTGRTWVEIVVSDAGDGIPPDFVAEMFDRHTRAAGTGTVGTGIGLAVARELAEGQGGKLGYRAAGNRFILTLPAGAVGAAG